MPTSNFIKPLTPINEKEHRSPKDRFSAPIRIHIIKHGALGDILIASSLLIGLRDFYPDAYISWSVGYANRDAIEANPYVDEILLWDGNYFKLLFLKYFLNSATLAKVRKTLRSICFLFLMRSKKVNILINFHPEDFSSVPFLLPAKFKIAVTCSKITEAINGYDHFHNSPFETSQMYDLYLQPLKFLQIKFPDEPRPLIGYTKEDAELVSSFLESLKNIRDHKPIIFVPSTTWQSKNWPAEYFIEIGKKISADYKNTIIVIGSKSEKKTVDAICSGIGSSSIAAAGAFSFRQLPALFNRSELIITCDTSTLHIAEATKSKCIALFGPTDGYNHVPEKSQVVRLQHTLPCAPCYKMECDRLGDDLNRCMKMISVENVYLEVKELLANQVLESVSTSQT
jgi:ADP-heptose:LPS heptosyltransferase